MSAGTHMFRVHQKRFLATAFNPIPSHRYFGGGRFDATDDDPYPFLYAGATPDVAVAETILRDIPSDFTGRRHVPRARYSGRRQSAVITTRDLKILDLRGLQGLGSVRQDSWLVHADPLQYAQTRHWAHWIRLHCPDLDGFVWMSHREPTDEAYVLFGSPHKPFLAAASHPEVPDGDPSDFDTVVGRRRLRTVLARHGYTVVVN